MLTVNVTELVPSENCNIKITNQMKAMYHNEKFNPVCLHPNGSWLDVNY